MSKKKWIDTMFRLPDEGETVLVYCCETNQILTAYRENGMWKACEQDFDADLRLVVVAWIPIPSPFRR